MTEVEDTWWYCMKHHAVERYEGCRSADRLGPYSTRDEAVHALERVQERNEAWDEDPRWNDEEDEDERGDR
ncbi:hypothetical protein [Raineyella sp. LH-20]|uniref:hypothetical protein n=1 Tax=Raineyella sp. LH-20 TaxID=3081204 RepID=UPI002955B501|nr:hypothetical protein [Raineyella sp. LH-20]WOP17574.1 hypothetical protein R0146_09845 [Raineyella sp. LH-20]